MASDGHKAGIYRLRLQSDQELEALPADLSVILPREAVKWLGALDFKAKDSNFVVFTLTATTVKMAFVGGGEATFDLIDGTFPDWQRTAIIIMLIKTLLPFACRLIISSS